LDWPPPRQRRSRLGVLVLIDGLITTLLGELLVAPVAQRQPLGPRHAVRCGPGALGREICLTCAKPFGCRGRFNPVKVPFPVSSPFFFILFLRVPPAEGTEPSGAKEQGNLDHRRSHPFSWRSSRRQGPEGRGKQSKDPAARAATHSLREWAHSPDGQGLRNGGGPPPQAAAFGRASTKWAEPMPVMAANWCPGFAAPQACRG